MERNQNSPVSRDPVFRDPVSRDVVRAVLTTRDLRHNETHALLLALYQGLVAELVEQGALHPAPLAERVAKTGAAIPAEPHGTPARNMLDHVLKWLCSLEPGLPPPHPSRWEPPKADDE